jgi:hypothetical protein
MVDNRSTTLEPLEIKFVGRSAFVEAHAQFDRTATLLRLEPATRQLQLDCGMTAACFAVDEMSEREHASLRAAAYLIAVERTARACRKRGWV